MGMICQAAGDRGRAEDCFQKTVYLDPMHDEALLALALLAERRGDHGSGCGLPPPRRANRDHDQEANQLKWRRTQPRLIPPRAGCVSTDHKPGDGDCWNQIGVSGDRSCPELETFIHCRNCPVFAAAARTFFDRPAPEGYLAGWSSWLAGSVEVSCSEEGNGEGEDKAQFMRRRSAS